MTNPTLDLKGADSIPVPPASPPRPRIIAFSYSSHNRTIRFKFTDPDSVSHLRFTITELTSTTVSFRESRKDDLWQTRVQTTGTNRGWLVFSIRRFDTSLWPDSFNNPVSIAPGGFTDLRYIAIVENDDRRAQGETQDKTRGENPEPKPKSLPEPKPPAVFPPISAASHLKIVLESIRAIEETSPFRLERGPDNILRFIAVVE